MRRMRGATRGVWRPVAQVAGLAVLVVAGALAAAAYRAHAGGPGSVSLPNGADSYLPAHRRVAGPQIEMVYVGGSDCAWSNQPGFPKAVDRLKKRLAMAARARGMSFRAVGLAVEWSVQKGEAHLNKLGYFDEVSVGYNWGNSLALKYLWNPGATRGKPEVLVYRRYAVAPTDSTRVLEYGEKDRVLLLRGVGYESIERLAAEADPIADVVPRS